jgi:hemolysin activation/secretion protein
LEVADRLPLRVFAGYEDTGTRLTARDRLLGGFNLGDVFGLGHQLNYQYTADPGFDRLTAHSAGYVMPLPWRHTLSFFGSYVDINADLPASLRAAGFDEKGLNYQAALRYSVPLPLTKRYQHEFSLGVDFKHNKNDLLFNSASALKTETDVAQLAAGYNGSLSDRLGRTSFGLQGYYSPGGLIGNDSNDDYDRQHSGSTADYFYGRLTVERVTRLPLGCSWVLRGIAQGASGNLIPSEQLGVGGYSTVRGYEEREANGDQGGVVSAELRSPSFRVLGRVSKWKLEDQLQFLAFYDYGYVKNVHLASGESPAHFDLESVGGGLRYTANRYLSVRFDYAYRLVGTGVDGASGEKTGSRAHVGVIVSF